MTGTQPRPLNFFEILFDQQSASISQQAGSQPYPYPVFGPQQPQQPQQFQYPAYGYQQYQQPAYASQQTGYQLQHQQPARSYQQTGQQRQLQSGYANQQAGQSTRTR